MKTHNTTHAQRIAKHINTTRNPRSAWDKGVMSYALEMLESYEPSEVTKEGLLNGARDWDAYSYGGCADIYDADIAERLCTPSELKRTRNGELNPNTSEDWLQCQARALGQASRLIMGAAKITN